MDHIFDDNQPIYLQIITNICTKILRGEFKPGDKLPSVIEAAMEYKVNHNTIARVYSEIVRSDIAVIKRGEGTFVTQNEEVLKRLHETMRLSLLQGFMHEMSYLGYSSSEVLDSLRQFIKENESVLNK